MGRPIIDPYFDAGPDRRNAEERVQRDGYRSLREEQLANGRTVAEAVPGAPGRLDGAIIPTGTATGVPSGFNPHDLTGVELVIDPHIADQTAKLKLGELSQEEVQQAIREADDELSRDPNMSGMSDPLARRRFRGSYAAHKIANTHQHLRGDQSDLAHDLPVTEEKRNEQQAQQQPPNLPTPAIGKTPPTPASVPNRAKPVSSPMQAFGAQPVPAQLQPGAGNGQQVNQQNGQQAPLPASGPAAPQYTVVFEFEHLGEITAHYHDVIQQGDILLLIYDTRYDHGTRYFPPDDAGTEGKPKLAAWVEGTSEVHMVASAKLHYTRDSLEHYGLRILQTVPYAG